MPRDPRAAGATAALQVHAPSWALLGKPDFWRLWTTGVILFVVRWLEMLAMGVFVYQKTGSAFLVAMLTMLRLLPMAIFGAFMGALADRIERRTALVFVILCLLVTSTALGVLAWSGALAIWHLAAATFINGAAWSTDNPVRRILIGEVAGADQVGRAMSLDIGTNNASRMIGPMIGGVVLAAAGIAGVFAISIVCYGVAAVVALGIRHRSPVHAVGAVSFLGRIAEGFAVVRAEPRIVGTLTVTIVFNVFGWPFTSMIPVLGQDHLLLRPEGIGILASMDGLGAFAGATLIALWARPKAYPMLYIGGTVLYLLAVPVFALVADPAAAGAALLFTGVTGAAFMTMQSTLIYVLAPSAIRSRVFGVLSVCIGLGPLGFVYIGWLADLIGAPAATASVGIEGIAAMAFTYRLWRPLLRG